MWKHIGDFDFVVENQSMSIKIPQKLPPILNLMLKMCSELKHLPIEEIHRPVRRGLMQKHVGDSV